MTRAWRSCTLVPSTVNSPGLKWCCIREHPASRHFMRDGLPLTNSIATSFAVIHLVENIADNKLLLGRRYAEWCTGAPALEAAVAAASMAQDEIGHARSLYPLLQDLAGRSEQTEPESRTQFLHVPGLSGTFQSWTDFVAANLLIDSALTTLLESARASSF